MIKTVIIEIPKHSNVKYELNPETGRFVVDRILYGSSVYPQNYGYFENTLDWDGDALDSLVISNHSFLPGVEVEVRVLGVMHMIDGGETDSKIISVINNDPRFKNIKTLEDVSKHLLDEIKDFFETYKNLQNKKVSVSGFGGLAEAEKEFNETIELYNKYKDMDKEEFIKEMKIKHPNKYQ